MHDLTDAALDTRFLGDLYQDLSQAAKKTYALLQTPVFVEEFILDRTFEPALAERPLEGFRRSTRPAGRATSCSAPSPACSTAGTGTPPAWRPARVQEALDSVYGVDLNPSPSPSPASASPSPR